MAHKNNLLFLLLFQFGIIANVFTQTDTISKSELFSMSLEELMQVEINIGTVTPTSLQQTPVSVTVIDKESIYMTPARNILDLIEIYVPGATFTNHWLGSRIGIRGVSGDQNTSFLLLLNGQNINMKTTNGASYEIQNRDLNDIESIEVIRGPGSVTYGAGAIGGIINIKTIPKEQQKLSVGIEGNGTYRYGNIFVKGGVEKENWTLNYYTSINRSWGIKTPEFFYIDRAYGYGYGFVGWQWGNKGIGTPAPNFYGDYNSTPQLKAQISWKRKENLHFWARYSDYTYLKQSQATIIDDQVEYQGIYGKQFIATLEYTPIKSEKFNQDIAVGFLSQSNRDVAFYNLDNAALDDITQFSYSYAQNEWFINTTLNYNLKDHLHLALGGDFRYLYLGPEWGKDRDEFLNSFPAPLRFAVYDSTNSGFYQQYGDGIVTQVDNTIDGYQYAVFSEAKFFPLPSLTLLLSARVDKHEYSEFAFSPRAAIVAEINLKNTFKAIVQQAVRIPTFNELYTFNYIQGQNLKPEVKKGVELIYQYLATENLYLDVSAYYNTIDQIAWTMNNYPDVVGTFDLIGTDIELHYRNAKATGSISYSFIGQNQWDPVADADAFLTNIGVDSIQVQLTNYGVNRLNNFPQHSIKTYINYHLNNHVSIHADARLSWGYGQKDMLDSFAEVHENYGTEITLSEFEEMREVLYQYGYTKPSLTSNFSVNVKPKFLKSCEMQVYATNLFQINHIRYVYQYWEEGNNRQYPRQIGFIKEPTAVGFKFVWNV